MNKFEFKNLTPFKCFVLENFPFIEADFDGLTEWQLFCKISKEINKIINSQNTVGNEMEILSQAFIDLQNYVNNYFENLDVQEEINNKLNEMTESGELQNILLNYTKISKIYHTFDELIQDQNLINGQIVKVLGQHNINDGGDCYYYITNQINDLQFSTNTPNLYAMVLYTNELNPILFGCYGDGIHDDTENLQNAITFCQNNKIKLSSPSNKIYLISNTINLTGNYLFIDFNNSTIKLSNEFNLLKDSAIYIDMLYRPQYDEQKILRKITNLSIDGNFKNIKYLIDIEHMGRCFFTNINIINTCNTAFYIHRAYELYFENIFMSAFDPNESEHGIGDRIAFDVYTDDLNFQNITAIDYTTFANVHDSSNPWSHIHIWIQSPSILKGSTAMKTNKGISLIDDFYSDTYETVFESQSQYGNFKINGLKTYFNDTDFTFPTPEMYIFKQANDLNTNKYYFSETKLLNSLLKSGHDERFYYNFFNGDYTPLVHYDNSNTFTNIKGMDNLIYDSVKNNPDNITIRYNNLICNELLTQINYLTEINISGLSSGWFKIGEIDNYKLAARQNCFGYGIGYSYSNKSSQGLNVRIDKFDGEKSLIEVFITQNMIDENVNQLYINFAFQNYNSVF